MCLSTEVQADGHGAVIDAESIHGLHGRLGSLSILENDGSPSTAALVVAVLHGAANGVVSGEDLLELGIIGGPGEVRNVEALASETGIVLIVVGSSLLVAPLVVLAVDLASLELISGELVDAVVGQLAGGELNKSVSTAASIASHDNIGSGAVVVLAQLREGGVIN